MKRRSFFKSVAGVFAACAMQTLGWRSPVLAAPKAMKMAVVNPAWHNARYAEIAFHGEHGEVMGSIFASPKLKLPDIDCAFTGKRFDSTAGPMKPIPHFILVDSPIQINEA